MLKHCDLFAGTGAFSLASQQTAKVKTVFSNDFDPNAKRLYDTNFKEVMTLRDINDLSVKDIPPHDILTGGFPCQPFSVAGKQEGFGDARSNVFWKILEIINYHKPAVVILENVKRILTHDGGKTLARIIDEIQKRNYFVKYALLNTSQITGIPQNRERVYFVCFREEILFNKFTFDFSSLTKKTIESFLESNVDKKYYYTSKSKSWDLLNGHVTNPSTTYQLRRVYLRENKSNECPTLTANMGTGGNNVPIVFDRKGIRKLTPRECFNFQGFPQEYILPSTLSDTALYKLAGNAVTVPVAKLVMEKVVGLLLL
jgi:DNA (cytosine-5)-methyltransferase 1